MSGKVKLSSRLMTEVFWSIMFQKDEERTAYKDALFKRLSTLDALRSIADYNTGSITLSSAWSIYNVVRHFRPTRILEVGTFIGKSTISMAAALDDMEAPGEIYTCDGSNDIPLPWDGRTRIRQFPKTLSGDMLNALEGTFDLVLLDGRLKKADLERLEPLITPETFFILDDFEGMEKGVINLTQLMVIEKIKKHFLIFPPSSGWLADRGFTSHSVAAVLIPVAWFSFSRQG